MPIPLLTDNNITSPVLLKLHIESFHEMWYNNIIKR